MPIINVDEPNGKEKTKAASVLQKFWRVRTIVNQYNKCHESIESIHQSEAVMASVPGIPVPSNSDLFQQIISVIKVSRNLISTTQTLVCFVFLLMITCLLLTSPYAIGIGLQVVTGSLVGETSVSQMTLWMMLYALTLGLIISITSGIIGSMSCKFASQVEMKLLSLTLKFAETSVGIQQLRSHLLPWSQFLFNHIPSLFISFTLIPACYAFIFSLCPKLAASALILAVVMFAPLLLQANVWHHLERAREMVKRENDYLSNPSVKTKSALISLMEIRVQSSQKASRWQILINTMCSLILCLMPVLSFYITASEVSKNQLNIAPAVISNLYLALLMFVITSVPNTIKVIFKEIGAISALSKLIDTAPTLVEKDQFDVNEKPEKSTKEEYVQVQLPRHRNRVRLSCLLILFIVSAVGVCISIGLLALLSSTPLLCLDTTLVCYSGTSSTSNPIHQTYSQKWSIASGCSIQQTQDEQLNRCMEAQGHPRDGVTISFPRNGGKGNVIMAQTSEDLVYESNSAKDLMSMNEGGIQRKGTFVLQCRIESGNVTTTIPSKCTDSSGRPVVCLDREPSRSFVRNYDNEELGIVINFQQTATNLDVEIFIEQMRGMHTAHVGSSRHIPNFKRLYETSVHGRKLEESDGSSKQVKAVAVDYLTPEQLAAARLHPSVAFLQNENVIQAPPVVNPERSKMVPLASGDWFLQRMTHRLLSETGGLAFGSSNAGTGVTIYILDTGVSAHSEFGSRLQSTGFDGIGDGKGPFPTCNFHGTATASMAAGSSLGMAPNAKIVSVRVLGCSGSGNTSSILSGINWVIAQHKANEGAKSILSASLGMTYSKSGSCRDLVLENALKAAIDAGIVVVVSAGNDGVDAGLCSFGSVDSALVVGATTSTDYRADFSNYGSKVDVWAAGDLVRVASTTSSTSYVIASGTSFSAPLISGIIARFLSDGVTASTIAKTIGSSATQSQLLDKVNAGTRIPNNLLGYAGQDPYTHTYITYLPSVPSPSASPSPSPSPSPKGSPSPKPSPNPSQNKPDCSPPVSPPTPRNDTCRHRHSGRLSGRNAYSFSEMYYCPSNCLSSASLADAKSFDLYLQKYSNNKWQTIAWSTQSSGSEALQKTDASGWLRWYISLSSTGSAQFDLCISAPDFKDVRHSW